MKKFCVSINGRNFLVDMEGRVAKHGFFQVFFLEAQSHSEAEDLAVQKIRGDEDLRGIIRNPKDDPPVMVVDKMSELESFDGVEAMVSGKAWYREKKWWQFWR